MRDQERVKARNTNYYWLGREETIHLQEYSIK